MAYELVVYELVSYVAASNVTLQPQMVCKLLLIGVILNIKRNPPMTSAMDSHIQILQIPIDQ